MTTIERIASDIAERIGVDGRRNLVRSPWGDFIEQHERVGIALRVTNVLDVLHRFQAAGKLVVVTDDVAVFVFPAKEQSNG